MPLPETWVDIFCLQPHPAQPERKNDWKKSNLISQKENREHREKNAVNHKKGTILQPKSAFADLRFFYLLLRKPPWPLCPLWQRGGLIVSNRIANPSGAGHFFQFLQQGFPDFPNISGPQRDYHVPLFQPEKQLFQDFFPIGD